MPTSTQNRALQRVKRLNMGVDTDEWRKQANRGVEVYSSGLEGGLSAPIAVFDLGRMVKDFSVLAVIRSV